MAGKFINELSSNPPAPEDLVVFFDKSKAVTVQAPLSDVVGAGLNIAGATKGQTAVVDTKVDPISLETIPFLKWEKAGIDFGSTTTKPSAGTDEIITHDPVTGTNGKTTLAELIKSVLPPVTGADAGKQLTVDINGVAGWTADSSDLPVFSPADAKKQLTVNDAGDAVIWKADASELPAFTTADKGKQLTVQADGKVAWSADSSDLPAYTVADKGKQLAVKADGLAVEWVAANALPAMTVAEAGKVLSVKADGTGAEWSNYFVKGNYTASTQAQLGALGPVVYCDGLFQIQNSSDITSVSMPSLVATNSRIWITDDTELTEINLMSLNSIREQVILSNLPKLTTLKMRALARAIGINISNLAVMESLEFNSLTILEGEISFALSGCPNITEVYLPSICQIGAIRITTCPKLKTFMVNKNLISAFHASQAYTTITGAALSPDCVEDLLVNLARLDGTHGTRAIPSGYIITLSGGTSAGTAALTATAITAKDKLVSRGVTVTLNP
jgi:hypothetical protein